MSQQTFIATAGIWGYRFGLRIPRAVRESVFKRNWKTVQLRIGKEVVSINLPPSFWRKCHELVNSAIGNWLKSTGLDQWEYGNPPKIKVKHLGNNQFEIVGRA